jgi:hypothetical protein
MQRSGETVRCTVSNCEYWGQGNYCTADQILITAPMSPLPAVDKHGAGAEQLKPTPIREGEDTLCYTFEPRKSR